MTRRRREEESVDEGAVGPYEEHVDYEKSDGEKPHGDFIPEEAEMQLLQVRSDVAAPKIKKLHKKLVKNKAGKKILAARKINKLVSTIETLINKREWEQTVNIVTERIPTNEPTWSRDNLRNRLNRTRQEKGKHKPVRESTRERMGEDGRRELKYLTMCPILGRQTFIRVTMILEGMKNSM